MVFGLTETSLWGEHFWHLVIFGSFAPIFALTVFVQRLSDRRSRTSNSSAPAIDHRIAENGSHDPSEVDRLLRILMALGLFGSAVIHLSVIGVHFHESVWYGWFFVAAVLCQSTAGTLVLVRPTRATLLAVVCGSVAVVVTWGYSRLVGVPIGPLHGATEPVGLSDLMATIQELAVVVCGLASYLRMSLVTPGFAKRISSHVILLSGGYLGTVVALAILAPKS